MHQREQVGVVLTRGLHERGFWAGAATATTAAIVLAAGAVAATWPPLRPTFLADEVIRFRLEPPPGAMFARTQASVPVPIVAISRDGRQIAFIAAEAGQDGSVWIRRLGDVSVRRLPGTENAQDVFWSPDNQSIGFSADGRLKRIDVTSGAVQDLCEASFNPRGGAWNDEGIILFGDAGSAIRRVSAVSCQQMDGVSGRRSGAALASRRAGAVLSVAGTPRDERVDRQCADIPGRRAALPVSSPHPVVCQSIPEQF